MTDPSTIRSIIDNGGYTQLFYPKGEPLAKTLFGRLILVRQDFLLLENFDISQDKFIGHLLIPSNTKQRLTKTVFVKRMLQVGGKELPRQKLPEFSKEESLTGVFGYFMKQKERIIVNEFDRMLFGTIISIDNASISLQLMNAGNLQNQRTASLTDIASIEISTQRATRLTTKIGS